MLNNMIKIRINNEEMEIKEDIKVCAILNDKEKQILAVKVNNTIHSINYKLVEDCVIEPIDYYSEEGRRIYSRTLKFIFLKACYNLGLNLNKIEFTNKIGNNYLVRFKDKINNGIIQSINSEMWNIIIQNYEIQKLRVSYEEAKKIYSHMNSQHQLENFKIKTKDSYTFYKCGDFFNYLYGLIAPSTGYIKNFDIIEFNENSAILVMPNENNIDLVNTSVNSNKVFSEFINFKEFQKNIGINCVSDINMNILSDEIGNIIRYSEAQQNRKIVEIVNNILLRKDVKVIFIAGPSSSGKTTFSQKLEVQLKIIGKNAIHIAMDNYFHDLLNIPVVNAEKDYESINNLDLDLFSSQMNSLLCGKEVNIPEYNFKKARKEYKKENILQIDEKNDILIVEGIHGLNPVVHNKLIVGSSFKIYLAPLVTLGLDNFTKISSNDTRLLRRIVRDADIRGVEPEKTLKEWKKVLEGEKKNIFPFIESADEIFNTNLVYEIGVLKSFAEKLLLKIPESSSSFSDARRLYKTLKNFLSIETSDIPKDSILKEFIGNGCFNR